MENWHKRINYKKFKNSDGSFVYVITVDGMDVEVDAAVYEAYATSDRRERYCAERDSGRLFSLDWLNKNGFAFISQQNSQESSVENLVIDRFLAEQVVKAFHALSQDERELLLALVVQGVTEREYASRIGLSQNGVNKRNKKL
jgi:DNA-directed RNA polymerase specialized sigma24 family protein